jgi:hypothetical protein
MDRDDDLQLLLADADTHNATFPGGVPAATARNQGVGKQAEVGGFLWDELDAPNDLVRQRWAVIAPEGAEGDALLGRIQPLIDARAEQQHHPVKIYRVPARMSPDEAARWKKQVFEPSERHRDDLSRYQLLLGDLHQVPAELQVIQATDGFVGRLAFDRGEDYEAYVDKLLAAERARASVGLRAVFHTVHDGTGATTVGHRALIEPGLRLARELRARGPNDFPAEVLEGAAGLPSPDEFLAHARDAAPTAMFSVSHGAGAPRGGWATLDEQRARQGAMCFGDAGELRGADLASIPFLPGGVWFMLACFGAGTPATSKYHRWLTALAAQGQFQGEPEAVLRCLPGAGQRPFIAALPKAVLANPRGPLAFVGHLDLAWTYSFRELDTGRGQNRPGRFVQTLASLVRRNRVGAAFRELFRYFEQTNTELSTLDEGEVAAPQRRAHLWMLRQDLAGYVVLGDPAARLPEPPPRPQPVAAAEALDIGGFLGVQLLPPGPASPPAPTIPPIHILEEAIGHVLVGDLPVKAIAQRHGIDRLLLEDLAARYREAGRAAIKRG